VAASGRCPGWKLPGKECSDPAARKTYTFLADAPTEVSIDLTDRSLVVARPQAWNMLSQVFATLFGG